MFDPLALTLGGFTKEALTRGLGVRMCKCGKACTKLPDSRIHRKHRDGKLDIVHNFGTGYQVLVMDDAVAYAAWQEKNKTCPACG